MYKRQHLSSIFLGGMLSMSSTAIVFKAFDDMGLRGQKFTGVVLGVLVVEDLVAVVLMVLLSTLAVSKQVEGMEMLESILKLGAFLIFWSLDVYKRQTHNPEIAQYSSRNITLRDGHVTADTVNTNILSAAEALARLPKNCLLYTSITAREVL